MIYFDSIHVYTFCFFGVWILISGAVLQFLIKVDNEAIFESMFNQTVNFNIKIDFIQISKLVETARK